MLIDNLNKVLLRMRAAAERCGRNPKAVRLVAVTKYASIAMISEVIGSGLIAELAESRTFDAAEKRLALSPLDAKVRWRLIGHLQTNKAKKAIEVFDAVDSIDGERTAMALDAALAGRAMAFPVMVQVKLSQSQTQSGVAPQELPNLLKALAKYQRLSVEGLMMIAPNVEPVEDARPSFCALRKLRDRHLPQGLLSMGMSRDFEIAIEEGADLVRIGSQIFFAP